MKKDTDAPASHEPETTEGSLAAPSNAVQRSLTVPGDVMMQASQAYTEEERGAVRWLYSWAHKSGLSLKELESEVRISSTTLYRVFNGTYAAKLGGVVEKIETFRRLIEERGTFTGTPFVETSISKKIWGACQWALVSQSIAFVFGNRGVGKTVSLDEYAARNNHGQTKLVRMPASAGVQLMMQEFAKSCFVSPQSCFDKLRDRVLHAIDGNNLVIVDELHQVFLSYQRGSAIKCLEVIREIHDRTKCGMVLCGTNRLRQELMLGANVDLLEQFTDRGILQVQLPKRVPKKDVMAIAAAFGISQPPTGSAAQIVDDMIESNSLRKFGKLLQAADRFANKQGHKLGWADFVHAHDIVRKLSEGEE